jgi:hypothetical protein
MADEPVRKPGDDVALTLVVDGRRREITVRELCVGNKMAHDALLSLLFEKGIVTAEELHDRLHEFSQKHFRPGEPPAASPGEGGDA